MNSQLPSSKPATIERLNACIGLLRLLKCDWCHAVWVSLQHKHATYQLFIDATDIKFKPFYYKTALMMLNSHQRGWPSWPPRTSHTLSADPHDTHSTPRGLPTKANTETTEMNTLNGQCACVCVWACVSLRTSKSLGWNMFLMMTTFSCLFLTSPFFSGLQSNCLHGQRHKQTGTISVKLCIHSMYVFIKNI